MPDLQAQKRKIILNVVLLLVLRIGLVLTLLGPAYLSVSKDGGGGIFAEMQICIFVNMWRRGGGGQICPPPGPDRVKHHRISTLR